MARKEYELTTEQFDRLKEVCRPSSLIALQCGMPASPQENVNAAWIALGKELGFDGMSAQPSDKGLRYFTAEPQP